MPAGLGFIVQVILGMKGFQSLLQVGALSVRFFVLMAVCSVGLKCFPDKLWAKTALVT